MNRLLLMLAVCLVIVTPTLATEPAEMFERANSLFETSVAELGRDDRGAAEGLRRSAELYLSLVDGAGIESSDVLTNAGNARLLAGDTGEAIALYHRALRVDPTDGNARANLEVARTRASADATISQTPSVVELLFSWRKILSPTARTLIASFAWAALWAWATVCIVRSCRPRWLLVVAPGAAVALVMAVTLLADLAASTGPPLGVVIVNETTGRTGPDAMVYDPSFTTPLPEGVEFTVIDQRTDWVLGRLDDGRETWFPVADVRLIGG